MSATRIVFANIVAACLVALSGCGGGGGNGSGNDGEPTPPGPRYTVSGTVTGLAAGNGLTIVLNAWLRNNNAAGVTQDGPFTVPGGLPAGSSYAVLFNVYPNSPKQSCRSVNGNGHLHANVTDVVITCTNDVSVGGTVSGLVGAGLALRNLEPYTVMPITADGAFTFPVSPVGAGYDVEVYAGPSGPTQLCSVENGTGKVPTTAVTNIRVSCVTQTPRFAHTVNFGDASISVYNADASTGQLRMRSYARTGQSPIASVTAANGQFIYVLNSGAAQSSNSPPLAATTASISAFKRDGITGALSEAAGSPYSLPFTLGVASAPGRIVIHPNDRLLYVANVAGNSIFGFAIDTATGVLSPLMGSPFPSGDLPSAITFNAQGTYAYVTNNGLRDISRFRVDTQSGALSEILLRFPTVDPGSPTFTLHKRGRTAFVVNSGSARLKVYSLDDVDGSIHNFNLHILPGPVIDGPIETDSLQSLGFVRVSGLHGANDSLAVFWISWSELPDLPGFGQAPLSLGVNSSGSIAAGLHPNRKFLYVANRGSQTSAGSISAFRIKDGVLTALPGVPALQPGPTSVVVDPSGKFLYANSGAGDQLYSYRIDETSGDLSPLPRAAGLRSGSQPVALSIAISPQTTAAAVFKSKFAYVANSGSSNLSNFIVGAPTGALANATAPLTTMPGGGAPSTIATSQGSPFAFAIDAGLNSISALTRDTATGVLSIVAASGGTQPTGAAPMDVAIDPSGRFVYVISTTPSAVTAYTVNRPNGTLTTNTAVATLPSPTKLAVDPTGRNLVVMNTDQLQVFSINKTTGEISPQAGSSGITPATTAGSNHFAFAPNGRFLYVAGATGGGCIDIYPVDPITGLLGTRSVFSTGKMSKSIDVDPTGRFAYTADNTANTLTAYTVDQVSGALGSPVPISTTATALYASVDFNGSVLHAVLGNNTVVSYAINQTDGSLAFIPGSSVSTGTTPGPIITLGEVE